jgi:hypothetical protein
VDSLPVDHDVYAENAITVRKSLERNPMLGNAFSGLEPSHLRASELQKCLGHGPPELEKSIVIKVSVAF